jgi:FkbM family methyltransferase
MTIFMTFIIDYSQKTLFSRLIFFLIDKTVWIFGDPIVFSKIGLRNIKHRFSHRLPRYLADFQNYSVNMAKIVAEVQKKYRNLTVIDVGANIGDSVALIKSLVDVPILCIDGNASTNMLLLENTRIYKNVQVEKVILGQKKKRMKMGFSGEFGTSHLEKNNKFITVYPLTEILKKYISYQQSKFLKIDTDGYDGKILRGSKQLIRKTKPIIFFEYDPYSFQKAKDNGLAILRFLKELGYDYILIYDNTGEYICSVNLDNHELLAELSHYIENKKGLKYYDVCVFSKMDIDLFKIIRNREINNWKHEEK